MFDNKIFDTVAGTLTANVAAAGSDTQIQFNDGGSFAGASGLLYDKTNIGLTLSRVADDALGPAFVFQQSRGAAGQVGDVLGAISFKGYNDNVTPALKTFATITASIYDATDTTEAGKISFAIPYNAYGGNNAIGEVMSIGGSVTSSRGSGTAIPGGVLIKMKNQTSHFGALTLIAEENQTAALGLMHGYEVGQPYVSWIVSGYDGSYRDSFTFVSAQSSVPMLMIAEDSGETYARFYNNKNSALGVQMDITKSRAGAAGQDGDILGVIAFKGYNDAATPELTEYTYIKSSIEDSADGAENGRLDFGIMSWGTEENILSIVKSVDTSSTCVTVGRVDSPSAQLHVDATYSEHDFAAKIINLTVNRTGLLVMGSDNDGRGINASGKTGITAVSNNHYGAGIVCGPDTNIDSVCLVVMRSSAVSLGYYDQPMVAFRCYDVALDNAVMLRMSYDYGGSGHTKTGNYIEMLHHTTLLYKHTGKNVITHYNTGITPSASVVDAIQMWCADYAAGDARLSIMGEKNTNTLTLGAGNVLLRPDTMADDSVSGETFVGTAGEDLAWGDVVYMAADGKFYKADADSSSTAPAVAFCTATISADASGEFLKRGWIRDDSAYNFTKGPGASGLIYLSTDAGAVTQTAPSGTGDQVQVLGWAYTADIWYFEPQLVVVEV